MLQWIALCFFLNLIAGLLLVFLYYICVGMLLKLEKSTNRNKLVF